MATIKVLQVHEKFDRARLQDYELADFEGENREKTMRAIYGYRADEASPYITVREVLSRISPTLNYIWYKLAHNKLYLYKDWRHISQGE